jgi:tetratricopeptide (TPR) repeat protein
MRKAAAIVGLSGAIVLALVAFHHSPPKALPSPLAQAPASLDAPKEQPLHSTRPLSDAGTAEPVEAKPVTNLLTRMANGEEIPPLRPEQVAAYLEANHRSVESLLGAYRTTRDKALLQEAAEKYSKDPRVDLEAAFFGAPEHRRKWLDAFKDSAPNNALANYLSAGDYFKAGEKSQALEELQAASEKSNFQDYFPDFVQNATEAYRAAGYSEAEAKNLAASSALLPQLAELKQVGVNLVDLAQSYRQAGDESSAQSALDMATALGGRLNQPDSTTLIQMLVGIAVEKKALGTLDPTAAYGSNGETVQTALDALTQQREGLKTLSKPLDPSLWARVPDSDLISFRDRQLLFGAQPALEWLMNKYGPSAASAQ